MTYFAKESRRLRTGSGIGESPTSQRRMVRSSRYSTSTAKRRADKPDALIALASSSESFTGATYPAKDSKSNAASRSRSLGGEPFRYADTCRPELGRPPCLPAVPTTGRLSRDRQSSRNLRDDASATVRPVVDLWGPRTYRRCPAKAGLGLSLGGGLGHWAAPVRVTDCRIQYRANALTSQGIVTNRKGAET